MKTKKQDAKKHAIARGAEYATERQQHFASGAAGIHSNQLARGKGSLQGKRQNTRASRNRAHIKDGW
jgi:hypothetical protein